MSCQSSKSGGRSLLVHASPKTYLLVFDTTGSSQQAVQLLGIRDLTMTPGDTSGLICQHGARLQHLEVAKVSQTDFQDMQLYAHIEF